MVSWGRSAEPKINRHFVNWGIIDSKPNWMEWRGNEAAAAAAARRGEYKWWLGRMNRVRIQDLHEMDTPRRKAFRCRKVTRWQSINAHSFSSMQNCEQMDGGRRGEEMRNLGGDKTGLGLMEKSIWNGIWIVPSMTESETINEKKCRNRNDEDDDVGRFVWKRNKMMTGINLLVNMSHL